MRIPNAVREKVRIYIKNRLDISDLVRPYDLNGEDFTGAILENFDISDRNISNSIFTRATIGKEGKDTLWNRIRARNCNFRSAVVKGILIARRADFRGSNFDGAYAPYMDFKYADFRGCSFCDTVFSIGTAKGYGAKFDTKFFQDLGKAWNIEIRIKEANE